MHPSSLSLGLTPGLLDGIILDFFLLLHIEFVGVALEVTAHPAQSGLAPERSVFSQDKVTVNSCSVRPRTAYFTEAS